MFILLIKLILVFIKINYLGNNNSLIKQFLEIIITIFLNIMKLIMKFLLTLIV